GKVLQSLQVGGTPPRTSNKRRSLLVVGTLAAMALLVALFYTTREESTLMEHRTEYGMIMDLTLPDGTSVTLNGNSRISYDKGNPRDISLEGEAYFNVKKIPSTNAKFWVTTNDLRIAVYGTQFHVNTRDEKTDVVLDEGSIHLLFDNGRTKQMQVGEMVSYAAGSQTFELRKLSKRDSYSVWRKGTFEFNNLSFEKVMHQLGETYGIKHRFTDTAIREMAISGGIPNQNLQLCIQALEKVTGTRMVMDKDTLVIFEDQK
ncbi:MAG: FecR family protein, partial [Flavobacteriaceae bacterium]